MKKVSIITIFLSLFTFLGMAQTNSSLAINSSTYKTAIGLRAGETSGLTLKKFVGSTKAVKGIFGFWNNGLSATILFEKYVPAFSINGLNWYYGAGGHIAIQTNRRYYYKNNRKDYYNNGDVGLGIDGVVGIEYKIPEIPFALSLDLKPYVEVITRGDYWMSLDPGLGVKVTF